MTLLASIAITVAPLAHTTGEIEDWLAEWQAQIPREGMTIEHALKFVDWHQRHFYWFHPEQVPRPAVSRSPSIPTDRGMGSNVEQWRTLVTQYFPDPDRALCIMSHESGGNPNATNPLSGAAGLFQHLPKYWGPPTDRSGKAGWAGADIYDPTANVAVAAWLRIRDGWGHWSPYNRGLCH